MTWALLLVFLIKSGRLLVTHSIGTLFGSAFYVDYHCFKIISVLPDSLKFGTKFLLPVSTVMFSVHFAVPVASKRQWTS